MDYEKLAEHVKDATRFEFPFGHELQLPKILGFQITKFMVLELIAAALMLAIFMPLARRLSTGAPIRGRFWNMFEVMLLFVRDEVARPAIGKHDADKFLPLIWNIFFFVLFCNLLGMFPWAGSPTGELTVTLALALITFCVVVGTGVGKFGPIGFLKSLVPHIDGPPYIVIPLSIFMFVIELFGFLVKHCVLAVRLLANMFAGHLVLAVILSFILMTVNMALVGQVGITVASVAGAAALSLLELLVAFVQAYVFTFLSALFIGMAAHPH